MSKRLAHVVGGHVALSVLMLVYLEYFATRLRDRRVKRINSQLPLSSARWSLDICSVLSNGTLKLDNSLSDHCSPTSCLELAQHIVTLDTVIPRTALMASVTDPITASALEKLLKKVESSTDVTFFRPTREMASITDEEAAGNGLKSEILKTGYTNTGFVGIGYQVNAPTSTPGIGVVLTLWIQNPLDDDDRNRRAVIKGLRDIINNPNVGKKTFTVNVQTVLGV
ncbi:hypothetical protein BD414DRAFT_508482 [Trametes punicea]|nr:hypothetical protein BD414DRAFT_508482 [Trametes punicea]